MILWLALLLFHDPASCIIQGTVYRMTPEEPISFARADSCSGIRAETSGPHLILSSPTHWVLIEIPPAVAGHRRFWYAFGSPEAHLGDTTLMIHAGGIG